MVNFCEKSDLIHRATLTKQSTRRNIGVKNNYQIMKTSRNSTRQLTNHNTKRELKWATTILPLQNSHSCESWPGIILTTETPQWYQHIKTQKSCSNRWSNHSSSRQCQLIPFCWSTNKSLQCIPLNSDENIIIIIFILVFPSSHLLFLVCLHSLKKVTPPLTTKITKCITTHSILWCEI